MHVTERAESSLALSGPGIQPVLRINGLQAMASLGCRPREVMPQMLVLCYMIQCVLQAYTISYPI